MNLLNLSIFHHLPHAHRDLLHHEDKALVKAGAAGLIIRQSGSSSSPAVSIEKEIDPTISRSQQNMELLVRDYLHGLPEAVAESEQGEALLNHWREILQEQPKRLAEAHLDHDHSRQFWKERLHHLHTNYGITSDHFPTAMDDWERAAGRVAPSSEVLGAMKTKQWQDMVIRQRLHTLDLDNMGTKR